MGECNEGFPTKLFIVERRIGDHFFIDANCGQANLVPLPFTKDMIERQRKRVEESRMDQLITVLGIKVNILYYVK